MSASESLKQLLKERKERDERAGAGIDWEVRKRERLQKIEELYADIESWLAPAAKEGIIRISRSPCDLSDPHLGDYTVETLAIHVGSTTIEFRPVGQLVVGATARVDVRCAGDVQTMAHFAGQGWKFLVRGAGVKTLPVNEDSFADFLKHLLDE